MLQNIRTSLRARKLEEGATAVEYGIMVALIAIVIIAAVWFIGQALQSTFDEVGKCIDEQAAATCPEGGGNGNGAPEE